MSVQIINPEAKSSTSTTPPTSTPTTSSSTAPAPSPTPEPTTKHKRSGGGHQKPATSLPPLDNDLTRVRVRHWLAYLGDLSASAFYARLKAGKLPPADGADPRPFWRAATVREYLSK